MLKRAGAAAAPPGTVVNVRSFRRRIINACADFRRTVTRHLCYYYITVWLSTQVFIRVLMRRFHH